MVAPLVVDEKYNLLVGHGRLIAARAEGLSELTCIVVEHLTDAQKGEFYLKALIQLEQEREGL
ncbi:MAG: ParB N-terminal domain-containing protein [Dethiobacteraceae bacterium]